MKYDVFGMGNPLIDILVDVDDEFIEKHGLTKGVFHPVDWETMKALLNEIHDMEKVIMPGDSTANTLVGVANFGGKAIFCGCVGDDEHGIYYDQEFARQNVTSALKKAKLPTGKAVCLITPDNQRTFMTYFGSALEIKTEHVVEEDIKNSEIVHLTGYQLEDANLKKVAHYIIALAKKHGKKLSIDFADPGVISRNKEEFLKLLPDVDIIFVNELEAVALTGKEEEDALLELAQHCDVAVVKLGEKGSLIYDHGAIHTIPSSKADVIDTTGAGDMYAAGILYGLTHDIPLEKAGEMASNAAAQVVSQKGARLNRKIEY